MDKLICRFVLLTSILIFGHSCSSPTDFSEVDETGESYTPLKVGILKQYVNNSDGTYQNTKISGRASREDGQEVYIKESNTSSTNNSIHFSYLFVRDGYLYATSLVKRDTYENPYNETRIAEVFAEDGHNWRIYDSKATSFTAHYIGQMTTPAGVFQDVFNYQYFDTISADTAKVYYAKGIGHIGSLTKSRLVLVNYVKIEDKEYGQQVPAALLPKADR